MAAWTSRPRCAATSACSASCSGGCSSSRRARACSPTRSGSARSRARHARAASLDELREAVRALALDAAGARAARVRALLPAREHRRAAPPHPPPPRSTSRGPAAARVARRGVRAPRRGRRRRRTSSRRRLAVGLARARAHGAPDRGDAADDPAPRTCASPSCSARSTTRRSPAAARRRRGPRSPRRSPCSGRRTRCARSGRASSDEIRHGLWFFELEPARRRAGAARRAPAARARRADPAPLRHAGSAATRTATRPSGRTTIAEALERARALALDAPARRGARARGCARARDARSSASPQELRRVDRARRARAARSTRGRARRAEPGRAVPPQALVRLVAARQRRLRVARTSCSPTSTSSTAASREHRGARIADGRARRACAGASSIFGFHLAKLDVRLHARDLAAPSERVRETLRARSSAPARATAREALDTVDRLRDDRRATTCSRVLELTGRAALASCRCSRRSTTCAPRPRSWPSCSTTPRTRAATAGSR